MPLRLAFRGLAGQKSTAHSNARTALYDGYVSSCASALPSPSASIRSRVASSERSPFSWLPARGGAALPSSLTPPSPPLPSPPRPSPLPLRPAPPTSYETGESVGSDLPDDGTSFLQTLTIRRLGDFFGGCGPPKSLADIPARLVSNIACE